MNHWNKVYELHRILSACRHPVSRARLLEELECSPATLKRVLATLRDEFGAPIHNERGRGWSYRRDGREKFELPGLWLSNEELHALALLDQLLAQIDPGLLSRPLAPVRARIEQMKALLPGNGQALARLKLLPQGRREVRPQTLGLLARATVERRRLRLDYHSRGKDEHSARIVSPQHLARYRDNWYLDAWCHQRDALRRFAVDRVSGAERLDQAAHEVDPETLQHLDSVYGIFTGPAANTAVLRFSAARARWIADEHWHDAQQGHWLPDGRYELRVPYGDPTELLMDVLRHVPEVEVVAPAALRAALVGRLRAGLEGHEPPALRQSQSVDGVDS